MPTEPHVPTLAEVAHRAAEVVDPAGADDAVAGFLARFEDRDEPVTAIEDVEQVFDGARQALDAGLGGPSLTVAAAVGTYLAHRRDELDDDAERIIRLAVRAEFHDQPDEDVAQWLAERGVAV